MPHSCDSCSMSSKYESLVAHSGVHPNRLQQRDAEIHAYGKGLTQIDYQEALSVHLYNAAMTAQLALGLRYHSFKLARLVLVAMINTRLDWYSSAMLQKGCK